MKRVTLMVVALSVILYMVAMAPAFVRAEDNYDRSNAAKWLNNLKVQIGGAIYDIALGGMLYRGIEAAQRKHENAFWQLESGFRYLVTPEHVIFDRTSTLANVQEIPFYYDAQGNSEAGMVGKYLANNRIYTYGKVGAVIGGFTAAGTGVIAGFTKIETMAVGAAAGATGGALFGYGVDQIPK